MTEGQRTAGRNKPLQCRGRERLLKWTRCRWLAPSAVTAGPLPVPAPAGSGCAPAAPTSPGGNSLLRPAARGSSHTAPAGQGGGRGLSVQPGGGPSLGPAAAGQVSRAGQGWAGREGGRGVEQVRGRLRRRPQPRCGWGTEALLPLPWGLCRSRWTPGGRGTEHPSVSSSLCLSVSLPRPEDERSRGNKLQADSHPQEIHPGLRRRLQRSSAHLPRRPPVGGGRPGAAGR